MTGLQAMPTVEVEIDIHVPPEVVVGVLLDAELAPAWTTGLERLEVVRGEPGIVGCVGRAHYIEGNRRYVVEDVLEQVEPGRRYVSRLRGGGLAARVETTLEPAGEHATHLSLRWRGHGTNPVTWVVLSLVRRRIAHRALGDLEKLRVLAEGTG